MNNNRPSESLREYDDVLTIKTSIGRVPVYKFIEKFLWIENAEGYKIPFILNEEQCEAYRDMCEQKKNGNPIRLDILKARQLGFSTFIAAVIFVCTIFDAGKKAIIIADIAEHASNLFDKYNFFYDNLPNELKIKKIRSNAKELVVEYPNGQRSSVRITVQGDSAGRSGTYQFLHLSECAFWQDLQKTLTALLQTVSQTNIESMIFLETTANGMNEYKSRWDNDYAGKTKYKPEFFAWWRCERYVSKRLTSYEKPEWLIELKEAYKLSEEQCQWYWEKYLEFNEDLDMLRQEYPSSPVEAFVTSGNAVFNAELLRKRKDEIMHEKPLKRGFYTFKSEHSLDGKQIDMKNIEWVDSKFGSITIYEEVKKGHPYVVSNDPSNSGLDYYATQVFDNYTGCQVAVYHKNKCDADDPAYQMYCLARYYNNALITGETNTTSYLLEQCYKMGYRFIYQDQDVEDLSGRYINKFGFKTKTNNRTYMIDLFKIAFRDNPRIIRDYETICEMETFQVIKHANGKEKAEAVSGEHDDLVMSCCGYYLCKDQQTCVPNIESATERKSIEQIEREREERYREKENQIGSVYQIWD